MALQSFTAALACLALLYVFMPRLPKGIPRLLLLLLCLPVFVWVPFSTHSYPLRAVLSFSFLWICPSKLLLLSWDLSPEFSFSHGFLYFLVTMVLPVHVKGKASPSARTKQGDRFAHGLKFLLFLVVLNGCRYREGLPLWKIHILYCLLVFLGLELVMGLPAKLARALLGVETYPHSDKPFLASSLSEFWGRRWNLVASRMLRQTVYDPILHFLAGGQRQDAVKETFDAKQSHRAAGKDAGRAEAKSRKFSEAEEYSQTPGRQENSVSQHENLQPDRCSGIGYGKSGNTAGPPVSARAVAMFTSFLASGLIHELIFCCITLTQATWEVTMFFVLHGFATVLEGFLRRELPSGWKLPRPLAILCTCGFVFFTTAWLFMPPITRSGADAQIIAEFIHIQDVVVDLFRGHKMIL